MNSFFNCLFICSSLTATNVTDTPMTVVNDANSLFSNKEINTLLAKETLKHLDITEKEKAIQHFEMLYNIFEQQCNGIIVYLNKNQDHIKRKDVLELKTTLGQYMYFKESAKCQMDDVFRFTKDENYKKVLEAANERNLVINEKISQFLPELLDKQDKKKMPFKHI